LALWNTVRQTMSSATAESRRDNLRADGERPAQAQHTYEQLLGVGRSIAAGEYSTRVRLWYPGYAMLAERDRSSLEWAIEAPDARAASG
jgi:hypothetical protein